MPKPSVLASLAAALLLLTIYSSFIPEPGPNELSRVDLAFALARRAQTSIDPYAANTIDRAERDGRYYSDKPLGLPLLAAPVLKAADRLLGLGDLGETRVSYVAHLLTAATVALPAALLAPLLAAIARRLGASPTRAALAAAALALGTAMLPFATTFYAHATSAALGVLAFALGTGILLPTKPRLAAFAAGSAAGLAALVEYPVLLIGATILMVRLFQRQSIIPYLLGGAIALGPLPVYNAISFGAPWRLGYGFVSDEAFRGMKAGLFGITSPRLDALEEITVGPSGLVTQSPWLLLGLVGLALLGRQHAKQALAAAAVVALFLLYNASYYLPMGGQSSGPRFLLPAVPLLALGLAFLPARSWILIGPAALASLAQLIAIAAVEPKTGPGHVDAFRTYWLPRLQAGDVALSWAELRYGLRGADVLRPLLVPLGLGAVLLAAIQSRSPLHQGEGDGDGARQQRRLPSALIKPLAALLFFASAATWLALVAPFGRDGVPGRFRGHAPDAPTQVGVTYGGTLELLGFRAPSEIAPGQTLDLTLFWRANAPIEENLTAFVHAVGRDGANLGGYDGPPVGAGYPTNLWPVGAIIQAPYRLRLDSTSTAPTELRIVAGLYGPGNMGHLPARDLRGQPLDPGPAVARLALRHSTTADQTPARARFEGGLELLSWQLPPPTRPGGSTTGTLRLRAASRPERDATVFVQAIGPTGPVAQWDAQPLRGAYPTSLWPVGEVVQDSFTLTVRAGTPPGDYPVIAGLYLLPELRRLQTGSADHVALGTLSVEP